MPKEGGIGQFADLRGGGRLGKKEGGVFLRGGGVDTLMHTMLQTIRRQQPTNCLSVFDHFVGLAP